MDAMTPFKLGHRPGLDGLRGMAVLFVLADHLTIYIWGDRFFNGGYVGVDLFFVLSGFLISSLLIEQMQKTGTIRFGTFYARRARRLLPALYTMLALSIVVWRLVPYAHVTNSTGGELRGLVAISAYVGNWGGLLPLQGGAYGVGQTWSLGIEEQFYLLWPLLLFGLYRLARPRLTGAVLTVVAAGSVFAMWLVARLTPGTAEAVLQSECRLFALVIGALLAHVLHAGWRPGRWTQVVGWIGFAVFVYWVHYLNGTASWTEPWGYLTVAVAAAAMILAVLEPRSALHQMMAQRWLRFTGQISYSLYVWHFIVFQVVANTSAARWTGQARVGTALGATLALSLASYYLIEQPILNHTRTLSIKTSWMPQVLMNRVGWSQGAGEAR